MRVENLDKRFGGLHALRDISFTVDPGEIVAVIGPNGAGKTTLFQAITGFVKPDSGVVSWNGRDITGCRPDRVATQGIARTFQISQSMQELTAFECVLVCANAGAGRIGAASADRRARTSIEYTGLELAADRLVSELTTADRHRLDFAKALALQPELVLLDEIAAGLWSEEQRRIVQLIKNVRDRSGTGFLIVEHKMDFLLSLADRAIVLNFGEVVAEGPPRQVLEDPHVVEAYFGKG